jgi:hypothetical protein
MAASGDDRGIEPREAAARPSALGEQLIETNRRFVEIRQPEIGEICNRNGVRQPLW